MALVYLQLSRMRVHRTPAMAELQKAVTLAGGGVYRELDPIPQAR